MKTQTARTVEDADFMMQEMFIVCDADQIHAEIGFLKQKLGPVTHMYREFCELREVDRVLATNRFPVPPELTARLKQLATKINRKLKDY